MANPIVAYNGLPFDFVHGLKVKGVDISSSDFSKTMQHDTINNQVTTIPHVLNSIEAHLSTGQVAVMALACSDETTDLATGISVSKLTIPLEFKINKIFASVGTAPTGSNITVDVKKDNVSILSSPITIDDSSSSSIESVSPFAVNNTLLGIYSNISVDILSVGSTVPGAGLKVYFVGEYMHTAMAYTPPNYPYFANVVLQLHFDGEHNGSVFIDSSIYARQISVFGGSPKTDTYIKKFGTSSARFTTTGSSIIAQHAPELSFGNGPFTIEFQIYPLSYSAFGRRVIRKYAGGTSGYEYEININDSGTIIFSMSNGSSQFGSIQKSGLVLNNWNHVSVSWSGSGSNLYMSVNGVVASSQPITGTINTTSPSMLMIGKDGTNNDLRADYYIDELRLMKGVGIYTSNFTPPSAPFSDN